MIAKEASERGKEKKGGTLTCSNNGDFLILKLGQILAAVFIVESTRVKGMTLELLNARRTRKLRTMQWTRVEHHKASVNGIIMVRNDPPDTLVLFPMNTQNLRLEQRFLVKTVMRGNPFRVLQQFRLMRVLFRRNISRLFEQRHVDETLNVALGAGISVPPPTSQQEPHINLTAFFDIHPHPAVEISIVRE